MIEKKKSNHKSTLGNRSGKNVHQKNNVIIRTQINILSVFDNIYIFLSRVNQGWVGGGRGLPNACACVRARYRWP